MGLVDRTPIPTLVRIHLVDCDYRYCKSALARLSCYIIIAGAGMHT